MTSDTSLPSAMHVAVPFGVSCRSSRSCRRASTEGAFALFRAVLPRRPPDVPEPGRPWVTAVAAGALAACAAAPPDRHRSGTRGETQAEGKTKGRGTGPRRKPVCTWGWRGTQRLRRRAAWGAGAASLQACPRASRALARCSLPGVPL